jgi:hypothetical protein
MELRQRGQQKRKEIGSERVSDQKSEKEREREKKKIV